MRLAGFPPAPTVLLEPLQASGWLRFYRTAWSGIADHGSRDEPLHWRGGKVNPGPGGFEGLGHGPALGAVPRGLSFPQSPHVRVPVELPDSAKGSGSS
ncbi:hypothetical protein Slala05_79970 [Streptomyces lavendulae subsp. lavendulae]|nr:hypothetical protein Slala05_79970 [Streptomyces lavendulae subsp. lavendulae]